MHIATLVLLLPDSSMCTDWSLLRQWTSPRRAKFQPVSLAMLCEWLRTRLCGVVETTGHDVRETWAHLTPPEPHFLLCIMEG